MSFVLYIVFFFTFIYLLYYNWLLNTHYISIKTIYLNIFSFYFFMWYDFIGRVSSLTLFLVAK